MDESKIHASWAVWEPDGEGKLTGAVEFSILQADGALHGRAMIVSLIPGSDGDSGLVWLNFRSLLKKHNDIFLAAAFLDTPLGASRVDLHPKFLDPDLDLFIRRPGDRVQDPVARPTGETPG